MNCFLFNHKKLLVAVNIIVLFSTVIANAQTATPPQGPQATGMCVGSRTGVYNGDVMTGGIPKVMETWDSKPYSSFAIWDTDATAKNGKEGKEVEEQNRDEDKVSPSVRSFFVDFTPTCQHLLFA